MLKFVGNVTWLLLILLLAACATVPEPALRQTLGPKVRLSPPPPEVMVPRDANYRERLLQLFSTSSTTPTETSGNSPGAKP